MQNKLITLQIASALIMLALPHFVSAQSAGQSPRLSGVTIGVGDWITVKEGHPWNRREEYGTLPSAGLYFSGWGWNGSTSLAVKSSRKPFYNISRMSIGDGEFTIGKKVGLFSMRTILRVPFYSWSISDPLENELFIGSGNVNVGLGLGGKIPTGNLPRKISLGYDLEVTSAVTQALADYGSTHATGNMQGTYSLGNRFKVGASMLYLFNYWRWIPSYWDQKGETSFTIVPGVVGGVRIFKALYIDAKAGVSVYEAKSLYKPNVPLVDETSYYLSLSAFQGF